MKRIEVLLITTDPRASQSLQSLCDDHSITCDLASNAGDGFEMSNLHDGRYDLIILDFDLDFAPPETNSIDLLLKLKAANARVPVLALSEAGRTKNKIRALALGADDYMTKPVNQRELLARIHAIVRRSRGHAAAVLRLGELCIDLDEQIVYVNEKQVAIVGAEYEILELLAMRIGDAVSRKEMLDQLYRGIDVPKPKIVNVFVCKLRKKLYQASGGKNYIGTVWGRGYVLKAECSAAVEEECSVPMAEMESEPEAVPAELSTV